jgi:hypothetical protein
MIVHRLKVWVSRWMALLAAAWERHAPLRAIRPSASQPPPSLAMVGAPPVHRSGLASSTWLRDSRRLRAQREPRKGLPAPAREQLRQIMRDPRWMATYYDTAAAARPPRVPHSPDPRAQTHPGEPTVSRPLASSGPPASADQRSTPERRRLNYVRELVQRGIYNEGFDPAQLPEQYRPRPQPPDASPPDRPTG